MNAHETSRCRDTLNMMEWDKQNKLENSLYHLWWKKDNNLMMIHNYIFLNIITSIYDINSICRNANEKIKIYATRYNIY